MVDGGRMQILSVACETTAVLRIIYWVNLFRKLLFFILPIVLIIVLSFRLYKSFLNSDGDYKQNFTVALKKIISLGILMIIPIVVNIIMSLTGYEIRDTYETCQKNATLEKISYYEGIEEKVREVKDLILNVKMAPTTENLQIVEEEVRKLYGIANGRIIEDLEYELASIRTKVTMTNDEFNCKAKGGIYQNGQCNSKSPSTITSLNSNGMVYYTYKTANDYLVVNTPLPVSNYISYIKQKEIRQVQSSGVVYYDQCLCFAEEYMHALTTGDTHKIPSEIKEYYYTGFVNSFDDDEKSKILNIVYSELVSNKPIILQVNGNRNGTSRHYVVVIGFKSTVTSATNLKETDLLFIDSHDGEVEQLHEWGTSRFMTTGAKCNKTYSGYQVYMLK